ncbi:uncharacterized protein LOC113225590 [Hyposmocoma kahamanoa]|uniref:uncharacterized protein LOC113225590 n=1 Tax=Hyposmocoma kahamanoa TaxID=1477025 RepID=UPI000E6D9F2B|nr:uncharacterized protein LOC113225590 [Hyposmocoma kahamanoa]
MIDPVPQMENNKKNCRVMDYTKSLSIPKLKNATLFIGYLNITISILFIIVSSVALASWNDLFENSHEYYNFFYFANSVVPPSVLAIGIICMIFTAALIAGTHMEKTLLMHIYLSFGVIGLMLSVVTMSVIVIIMACLGLLVSMIFAMQIFFFFGVYAIQLYVIQQTIEVFETPSNVQEVHVKDVKDISLPSYNRYEYAPHLTVAT